MSWDHRSPMEVASGENTEVPRVHPVKSTKLRLKSVPAKLRRLCSQNEINILNVNLSLQITISMLEVNGVIIHNNEKSEKEIKVLPGCTPARQTGRESPSRVEGQSHARGRQAFKMR